MDAFSALGFDASAAEVLSVLVILGAASLVVAIALVIAQRFERRSVAADRSLAGERLAGPDERTAARTGTDTFGRDDAAEENGALAHGAFVVALSGAGVDRGTTGRTRPVRHGSLIVIDDDLMPATDVVPWQLSSSDWAQADSDEMVELLSTGFRVDELAAEFGVESCSVLVELARRVFGALEPVLDPSARRFGQPWTETEQRTLLSAASAGLGIPDIARQLGRDQLSTVSRLLELAADEREKRRLARRGQGAVALAGVTQAGPAQPREVAIHR
ncbi:helix-turn-helix domain-containing protein [Labedella endophytica]|uniref:Helix-turn-helix domain-containing protein n=1 Tax=Labedella endophytica TaxID=1523160 RepID=A0A3S0VDX8_9MICO|nr:helix-turn-helix domain-containing protein [Labedella endophytica]RUQ98128.1 helix-turn-helix domain-containing protein [Labedella endophytica]